MILGFDMKLRHVRWIEQTEYFYERCRPKKWTTVSTGKVELLPKNTAVSRGSLIFFAQNKPIPRGIVQSRPEGGKER